MELPRFIIDTIEREETSIGDNPALPPYLDEPFLLTVVKATFNKLSEGVESVRTLPDELRELITRCQHLESPSIPSLEAACVECVNDIVHIPDDTVAIKAEIVTHIDSRQQRLMPEDVDGFQFDSLDNIEEIRDNIYKRRFLNALISGCALDYAINMSDTCISRLFHINPELPALYHKLLRYNTLMLFLQKDTLDGDGQTDAGVVNTYMSSEDEAVRIEAQALTFPILYYETLKGLFELAIAHGLPESMKTAEYVVRKSDFKLAENWDIRAGLALWEKFKEAFEAAGFQIDEEVGIMYFLTEFAQMPVEDFNSCTKEILLGTVKGVQVIKDMCRDIIGYREDDEFRQYMDGMSRHYQASASEFFEPNDLITDSQ